MPIAMQQNRQVYARYGLSEDGDGLPRELQGGNLDASIVCSGTITVEDLKYLVEQVDMFARRYDKPVINIDGYGRVHVYWHEEVPPPVGDGWKLY